MKMQKCGLVAILAIAAFVWLLPLGAAQAGSASTSLNVSAAVNANCTIATNNLTFGSYDVLSGSVTTETGGAVKITCTRGSVTLIGLDAGLYTANAVGTTRAMLRSGGSASTASDILSYEIYKDSGRTTVWGDAGTNRLDSGTAPSKAERSFTVYGKISAGQDVQTGSYADTVNARVDF